MVRCTITKVLTQLDCVILMHLSGGTVFSVLSLWGYRTCHYEAEGPKGIRHFGGFGTHLRLLLAMAVSVFGLWFWVVGIKPHTTDVVTDSGPCATVYTFMFAKVRADAGVRILYLIACISCVIYFGIMLLISTISLYARVAKGAALAKQGRWRTSTRLHYATGLYHKEYVAHNLIPLLLTDEMHFRLRRLFYFLRVANFLWIVWSMITVECTLNFNHVKGVLGPGNRIFFPSQLIPMIIGAFSFVRLGYKLLEKWRDPDDEPSLPQDAHTSMFTDPENSERSQAFPSKSRMFKLFAPPTDTLNHAPKEAPPEDNDIDDLMRDKPPRLRYLVSWLPWLSLLHRWKKDADRLNFHRRWTNQERGRSYSPATTLQGTPVSTNFVNPYMAQIPD